MPLPDKVPVDGGNAENILASQHGYLSSLKGGERDRQRHPQNDNSQGQTEGQIGTCHQRLAGYTPKMQCQKDWESSILIGRCTIADAMQDRTLEERKERFEYKKGT